MLFKIIFFKFFSCKCTCCICRSISPVLVEVLTNLTHQKPENEEFGQKGWDEQVLQNEELYDSNDKGAEV